MKKSECTPEQWDAYREYHRQFYRKNRERILEERRVKNLTPEQIQRQRERWAAYKERPHVKERRAWLDARPEAIAKRSEYAATARAKRRARERMLERHASDPDLQRRMNNYGRLLRTGFTEQLIRDLLKFQENRCAVCRREFSEAVKMHADHCHEQKKPRGLLCFQCNIIDGKLIAIGLSPIEFGQRLHEYLEKTPVESMG